MSEASAHANSIASFPASICNMVREYEQLHLHTDAQTALEAYKNTYSEADASSDYCLRLRRLTRDLQMVEGHRLHYHVFMGEGSALSLHSGDICLFSSMMDVMTDDELLFVIGHEIGHIVNEDFLWCERARRAVGLAGTLASWIWAFLPWGKVADAAVQRPMWQKICRALGMNMLQTSAANVVQNIGNICFSRRQEYAADLYALRFLHARGSDTGAAARALAKLHDNGADSFFGELAEDHPGIAKRIARLNRVAAVLEA